MMLPHRCDKERENASVSVPAEENVIRSQWSRIFRLASLNGKLEFLSRTRKRARNSRRRKCTRRTCATKRENPTRRSIRNYLSVDFPFLVYSLREEIVLGQEKRPRVTLNTSRLAFRNKKFEKKYHIKKFLIKDSTGGNCIYESFSFRSKCYSSGKLASYLLNLLINLPGYFMFEGKKLIKIESIVTDVRMYIKWV